MAFYPRLKRLICSFILNSNSPICVHLTLTTLLKYTQTQLTFFAMAHKFITSCSKTRLHVVPNVISQMREFCTVFMKSMLFTVMNGPFYELYNPCDSRTSTTKFPDLAAASYVYTMVYLRSASVSNLGGFAITAAPLVRLAATVLSDDYLRPRADGGEHCEGQVNWDETFPEGSLGPGINFAMLAGANRVASWEEVDEAGLAVVQGVIERFVLAEQAAEGRGNYYFLII